jgi:hypothetical protein
MSWGSLSERKKNFLEDCCGGGGMGGDGGGVTSSVGDVGFQSAADNAGPRAGYDPLMSKLDKVRRKRKEKRM